MKPTHACRCCLSEDCYKDITTEYFHKGRKENYCDMLFDTFNLNITYQEDSKRLICEECITKLRDATEFRNQVILAEAAMCKKLNVSIENGVKPKYEDDFVDRITSLHVNNELFSEDYGWQDDVTNDDKGGVFVIKLEHKEELESDQMLQHNVAKTKKNIKRKNAKPVIDRDDGIEDCEEIIIETETGSKTDELEKDTKPEKIRKKNRTPIPQSQIDRKQNTLKLIDNSNLLLFESLKIKFGCFYCKNSYITITELREHNTSHSNPTYLRRCINNMRGLSFRNADISNLICKLCSSSQTDLNTLQEHLFTEHKIEFPTREHLLIPFRLEKEFKCVFCDELFNTFFRLHMHMNKHYTNHVCEICGQSFINMASLRTHVDCVHREKKCTVCSAVFQNNYARVKHMRKAHNTKDSVRYCLLCKKKFKYTYMLIEHRIQEHGAKRPISNCLQCGKTFLTPQNLKVHIRSVHVRERNYPCSFCSMRFFTKCDQRRHERTHEDIRSFSCSYCEGRFKSKDSLRRHLKRQHRHLFVTENENELLNK